MAFCPNCGRENTGYGRFCPRCGTRLDISGSGSLESSGSPSQIDSLTGYVVTTDQDHGVSVSGSFYGLTRKSIWLMIFLTLMTLGIYVPYWCLTRHQRFNALSSTAKFTQTTLLIWLLWFIVDAVFIIVLIATPQSETVQSLEVIETILNLVAAIFGVILAFRARRILLEHLAFIGQNDTTMSGILTFFFGFFYIQYNINRLIPRQVG